jgi:Uncharacterized protein conserved in bacteria (DUF2252)
VILLLGRDPSDALFLQAKDRAPLLLERFAGRSGFSNRGQRVVEGKRLMQAGERHPSSDGWASRPVPRTSSCTTCTSIG